MKIIDEAGLPEELGTKNFGMAIGNFDGFHLGHQKILDSMLGFCQKHNMALMVMTFVPHPRAVLRGEKQFLINDYQNRRRFMEKSGLDVLYEVKFDLQFSGLSPEIFLQKYVGKESGVGCFFLGHDFSFGKNKTGGRSLVEKYCHKNGIRVEVLDEFEEEGEIISSSRIRNLLKQGSVKKANELLGREFFLEGSVVRGVARGRGMGFPTANLDFKEDLILPASGVYVTKVIYRENTYSALTNVGRNPTFEDSDKFTVETHILDFKRDLYGDEIKVCFVEKMRDEKKFRSSDELKEQLERDVAERRGQEI